MERKKKKNEEKKVHTEQRDAATQQLSALKLKRRSTDGGGKCIQEKEKEASRHVSPG